MSSSRAYETLRDLQHRFEANDIRNLFVVVIIVTVCK
jgi:hypothetical protein